MMWIWNGGGFYKRKGKVSSEEPLAGASPGRVETLPGFPRPAAAPREGSGQGRAGLRGAAGPQEPAFAGCARCEGCNLWKTITSTQLGLSDIRICVCWPLGA